VQRLESQGFGRPGLKKQRRGRGGMARNETKGVKGPLRRRLEQVGEHLGQSSRHCAKKRKGQEVRQTSQRTKHQRDLNGP